MTREELAYKVSSYLQTSEEDHTALSERGMDRFRWLTDNALVPLFLQSTEQLAAHGIHSEQLIERYHRPPYAALWVKSSHALAVVWQSESRDWINLAILQEGLFPEASVKALHYNAILRGKLAHELHFAMIDIVHSVL